MHGKWALSAELWDVTRLAARLSKLLARLALRRMGAVQPRCVDR